MNVALIEALEEEGLSAEAIIRVLKRSAAAADNRSSAAKRQARYREKKAQDVTSDVTSDVTNPPKEDIKPPSVSDETGGKTADPVKELIDMGVSMLMSQGHSERQARSLVGSWRKGRNDGEVVAALVDAKHRSISNLVEWMPRRLKATGPPGGNFMEQYEREMQQRVTQ